MFYLCTAVEGFVLFALFYQVLISERLTNHLRFLRFTLVRSVLRPDNFSQQNLDPFLSVRLVKGEGYVSLIILFLASSLIDPKLSSGSFYSLTN